MPRGIDRWQSPFVQKWQPRARVAAISYAVSLVMQAISIDTAHAVEDAMSNSCQSRIDQLEADKARLETEKAALEERIRH